MDNTDGMDRNFYGTGYGVQPQDTSVAGSVFGKDSFADMQILGDDPFEEGDLEMDTQTEEMTETDCGEKKDCLPVSPFWASETVSEPFGEEQKETEKESPLPGKGADAPVVENSSMDGENLAEEGEEVCAGDTAEIGEEKKAEEDRKRAEHEAVEAERKAEWEARRQAKKQAEAAELERLSSMRDSEVMAEAMGRVAADTEKLTRRNMKDCVAEHIQTLCLDDPAFARLAMHPRKSMIRCFHYVNRKAREFIEQEMKDNDMKPENGIYGSDVPDGLCYQWAEDYFRDLYVEEDKEKEEEFVPKPYMGKAAEKTKVKKAAATKKSASKTAGRGHSRISGKTVEKAAEKAVKKATEKPGEVFEQGARRKQQEVPEKEPDSGQLSFRGQISFEDYVFQEEKAG